MKPSQHSDAALFAFMVKPGQDLDLVRAAQSELYVRHVRYLYAVLLRRKQDLLAHAGMSPEDLVQETFQRAFAKAHTFAETGTDADADSDADRDRVRTRAWLGRIAQNLLLDHLTRLREVSATPYIERVSCEGLDDDPSSARSPRLALVAEGLEQLSEREQDVLRVTYLYYRAGDEHQRLPNAVSADLAQRWNTTNENIRAIRVRAMKKLRSFLQTRGLFAEEAS